MLLDFSIDQIIFRDKDLFSKWSDSECIHIDHTELRGMRGKKESWSLRNKTVHLHVAGNITKNVAVASIHVLLQMILTCTHCVQAKKQIKGSKREEKNVLVMKRIYTL